MQTTLVGVNFRPREAKEIVMGLSVGDTLMLAADPYNQYDANAVKVLTEDGSEFLGFVAKADNLELSEHLQNGGDATCVVSGFLSTLKPTLEIEF